MRSRYSAFAVGDAAYLLATWHPRTRPRTLDLDDSVRWLRLDILGVTGGEMMQAEGTVEFRAIYLDDDGSGVRRHEQHEVSRFVREGNRWLYLGSL